MKNLYQKISSQSESLKGLWVAKLNLNGRAGAATQDDLDAYDAKRHDLDLELERRKDLGSTFGAVLLRMKQLTDDEEVAREKHQAGFTFVMYSEFYGPFDSCCHSNAGFMDRF